MATRMYLLDTSILSRLVRDPQGPIAARIADVGEDRVLTSVVVAWAVCVIDNVAEFKRVPALKVENWLA